jgi:AraC-like DNA-binding protein
MSSELENILNFFEKWSGLRVNLYDHTNGQLNVHLSYKYMMHMHEECVIVKKKYGGAKCFQFDRSIITDQSWSFRNGGVKICPYGFMEWVMPVYKDFHTLICTIIVGIRQAPARIPEGIYTSGDYFLSIKSNLPTTKTTNEEEILFIMEGLRQLAARVQLWHQNQNMKIKNEAASEPRASRILSYIRQNFFTNITISSLAKHLHVSNSRAMHIIKELTGKTFKQTVFEFRIKLARHLLENSNLSIQEISDACGFTTSCQFFRVFKNDIGVAPYKYRKNKQSQLVKGEKI